MSSPWYYTWLNGAYEATDMFTMVLHLVERRHMERPKGAYEATDMKFTMVLHLVEWRSWSDRYEIHHGITPG